MMSNWIKVPGLHFPWLKKNVKKLFYFLHNSFKAVNTVKYSSNKLWRHNGSRTKITVWSHLLDLDLNFTDGICNQNKGFLHACKLNWVCGTKVNFNKIEFKLYLQFSLKEIKSYFRPCLQVSICIWAYFWKAWEQWNMIGSVF